MEEAALSITTVQVAMSMEVANQAAKRGDKKRALEVLSNVQKYVMEAKEIVSGMK
jgi:hypothetical protein